MNKILCITSVLLLVSCNKQDEQQVNKEFYFSPEKTESNKHELTTGGQYVDLQVKMHTAYRLLKALNDGVISQEEYDKLKQELI